MLRYQFGILGKRFIRCTMKSRNKKKLFDTLHISTPRRAFLKVYIVLKATEMTYELKYIIYDFLLCTHKRNISFFLRKYLLNHSSCLIEKGAGRKLKYIKTKFLP